MIPRSLESSFDRYRRKGDLAALGSVFDRTSKELWGLALRLVRDTQDAEDLVQTTWMIAIDRADSYDADRPLVPWLVGILVNQARQLRRRRGRPDATPVEPDPGDPDERVADPSQGILNRELVQLLDSALERVPDVYRRVLVMHLAEGRRPAEIARELERAPSTVRMQLHRGLELLRRSLPVGLAPTAALFPIDPAVLARIRAAVLESAVESGAASSLAPAVSSSMRGARGLGAIAAAVAAVTLVTVLGLREEAPTVAAAQPGARPAAPAGTEPAPDRARGAADERLAVGPAADLDPTPDDLVVRSAPTRPATSPGPWLTGTVSGAESLTAEVRIEVRGLSRFAWPDEDAAFGTPDPSGSFRIDVGRLFRAAEERDHPLEELVVTAEHPAFVVAEARVALSRERSEPLCADLELVPAALVVGRTSVGRARVAAIPFVGDVPSGATADSTISRRNGRFRLRLRGDRVYALLFVVEGLRPTTRVLRLPAGGPVELADVELEPGAVLAGRCRRGATPMPGAVLTAVAADDFDPVHVFGDVFRWTGDGFERARLRTTTDAAGRFDFAGLAPGPWTVALRRADDGAEVFGQRPTWSLDAPGPEVNLAADLALLRLDVRDGEGRPSSGALGLSIGGEPQTLDVRGGEARVALPPNVRVSIEEPGRPGAELLALTTPDAGQAHAAAVTVRSAGVGATLELRVDAAFAVETVMLALAEPDGSENERALRAPVRDGVARFEDLPAGRWHARLFAGEAYVHFLEHRLPVELRLELAPGAFERRAVRFERGGRLRIVADWPAGSPLGVACRLRDEDGAEVPIRLLHRGPGGATHHERIAGSGPFDVRPNLAPGLYELELDHPELGRTTRPVTIETGRTSEVVVDGLERL